MYVYFNHLFSIYLCGFRKGQHSNSLLFMLENLKKALDKGLYTGILLTDLSKAFDSLSHDLLIAKLNAYWFSRNARSLINDYLTGRKQTTEINGSFSTWREIIQGSILGPSLFNIYINYLFLFSDNFETGNYADDCSPFEFSGSIEDVISKLEKDSYIHIKWYESNYLKPNPDKWHLLLSVFREDMSIKISNDLISNSTDENILGVSFDNKLNLNITKLCKKAAHKLHALARISNFMSFIYTVRVLDDML